MLVEFNLELAKSGAKLVTRDGKEARLLCSCFLFRKKSRFNA